MDESTFDEITRTLGAASTRRGVLFGVGAAAVAALGLPGQELVAKKRGRKGKGKGRGRGNGGGNGGNGNGNNGGIGNGQEKVTICHKPGTPAEQTLTVAAPAVPAHLRHGDLRGPCELTLDVCSTEAEPTGTGIQLE